MSGSGRETLPNIRKALLDNQGFSVSPPVCPGVVGRHSLISGSVWEAVPNVQEWSGGRARCPRWSGGPPGCPGVVRRLSRMSGSGRETFPDYREWSEGPTECLGVVGRPSQMYGSDQIALPDV